MSEEYKQLIMMVDSKHGLNKKKQWSKVFGYKWEMTVKYNCWVHSRTVYGEDNTRQRSKRSKKDKERDESGVVWGTCQSWPALLASVGGIRVRIKQHSASLSNSAFLLCKFILVKIETKVFITF